MFSSMDKLYSPSRIRCVHVVLILYTVGVMIGTDEGCYQSTWNRGAKFVDYYYCVPFLYKVREDLFIGTSKLGVLRTIDRSIQ